MKFQSEKKELWRYASKNLQGPVGGTKRSPLLHRLQHQRLLQSEQKGNQNHSCNNAYANDSGEARSISTPPPPYSSIPELNVSRPMDYQEGNFQNHLSAINGDADVSMSATESEMNCSQICGISKGGYNIVNTGDIMLANNYENLNEISTGSNSNSNSVYLPPSEQQKKLRRISPIKKSINCDCSPPSQTITSSNSATTTTTGLFAATAAKILRNCCGGGFGSTNSESTANSSDNNNSCNKNRTMELQTDVSHPSKAQPPEQYFNALMKQLKASQITLLLKAVKARHEPTEFMQSNLSSTSRNTVHTFQANCILTQRALILGEEPYLIACRLFLWRDLKRSSQLKRLPACPNECDPVYVCCNPLHWCRILETETPPPIYQSQNMNQNEGENTRNDDNCILLAKSKQSHKSEVNKISSIEQNNSEMHGRFPVPLSTGGEDNTCPLNWCEIAYWEMAQRVGERYPAQGSTLNIYSETPYSAEGKPKTGMCLKDLVEKRNMPSPDHVQYTRQKIGLGITLQREIDGVWLYNRSTVPIFLYSPTLTESWFRVCRVEPGDCIRAFDKYRAQTLIYPAQFPGVQIGPIDTFSMRISFGKGWGYSYKRPDITRCPCWLEVLFTPQR